MSVGTLRDKGELVRQNKKGRNLKGIRQDQFLHCFVSFYLKVCRDASDGGTSWQHGADIAAILCAIKQLGLLERY